MTKIYLKYLFYQWLQPEFPTLILIMYSIVFETYPSCKAAVWIVPFGPKYNVIHALKWIRFS